MAGHICAECFNDKNYGGCCSIPEDYNYVVTPLTSEDIEEISEFTGLHYTEFTSQRVMPEEHRKEIVEGCNKYSQNDLGAAINTMKLWVTNTQGEYRTFKMIPSQRKEGESHCFFLDEETGCVLGDARPPACKMFPLFPVFLQDPTDAKNSENSIACELRLVHGEGGCLARVRAENDSVKTIELLEQTPEGVAKAAKEYIERWVKEPRNTTYKPSFSEDKDIEATRE